MVVWNRGNGELWQRNSNNGGVTWSIERQIAGCCRRNPSLAAVDGVLWLAYEQDEDIWYRTSANQGAPGQLRRASRASWGPMAA